MWLLLLALALPGPSRALVIPKVQESNSSPTGCSGIQDVFRFKNISVTFPQSTVNGSGLLCGGQSSCCSAEMEAILMKNVAQDLHSLLYHSFHSVHGMLGSSESAITDAVRQAMNESSNMTLSIFAEVYKGMWDEVVTPVGELYRSLEAYLARGRNAPTDLPPAVPSGDAEELEGYVRKFFRDLFPLVYQEIVHKSGFAVSDDYAACLSRSVDSLRPFGSYPDTLAKSVAKSFETTKVLLEALSFGIEVLDVMSGIHDNTDSCREALLRLYYCPKCLGLPSRVKPCNGYCLNVMRGCLTQERTTELDLPWSNFLEEVERLVAQVGDESEKIPSIDNVLYGFSTSISDAIMYAAMDGPQLEKKVKSECGSGTLTRRTSPEPQPSVIAVRKRPAGGQGPVSTQLRQFGRAVEATKARGYFANLAEALCSDDSFAETRDTADCWNGHRVGEYTKALVKPGLDSQKYNPELKWKETAADPNIQLLSDKLRHMRQVVLSHSRQAGPPLVSFAQTMGSGSGESGHWDDTDDSDHIDQNEGSGSGDGHGPSSEADVTERGYTPDQSKPKKDTGGAGYCARASIPIIILFLSIRWIL